MRGEGSSDYKFRSLLKRLNSSPRRAVFLCFAAVFAVTVILAGRQYFLGRSYQVTEREHRLQLQAFALNAAIGNGKSHLRFLRDVAERILLDQQDTEGSEPDDLDLKDELKARNDPVWGMKISKTDTPVRSIGKERLEKIPGLSQDDTRLREDLKLSRVMSQILAIEYQSSRYFEHVLFVSTTGLIVAYPGFPDEKLEPLLRLFASSRLMQSHPQLSLDSDIAFSSFETHQFFSGTRLLFSAPVVFNGVMRGAIIFDLAQRRMQNYLYASTPPDEIHVLLDAHGTLIASNEETFTKREGNWLKTLPNPLPGLSMPALFQTKNGVLHDSDNFFLYRELPGSGLVLIHQVPARVLRWSVISQFSTIFIFIWLSLGVLLVVTLSIVDYLLINQISLNEKLRDLGLVDTLTQLANRRRLHADFKGMVKRFQGKHPIALLMIDIDKFKVINDSWGHSTGDEVLKHIATLCRALVRPHDLVARYGGEEFCVLLPATTLRDANEIAEKLRSGIEQSVCLPDPVIMLATAPSREVHLTVSIGVAELGGDHVSNLEQLVARADQRLYAAKQNGRNRVVCDDSLSPD
jgi:diguanylate cyclase (GGDEF)-like protein